MNKPEKKRLRTETRQGSKRHPPPSYKKRLHRVRRVKGQLEGVERMIEESRYCPDIITQVRAVRAALASLESTLLEEHLNTCVKDAFASSNRRSQQEKIDEILKIVRRS